MHSQQILYRKCTEAADIKQEHDKFKVSTVTVYHLMVINYIMFLVLVFFTQKHLGSGPFCSFLDRDSIQFSFIYKAPNYNNCHLKALK